MIENRVKPKKIAKILESYVEEGTITKDELPTLTQISDFRRNSKKSENNPETQAHFTLLTEAFSFDNDHDSEAILIGKNLDPNDFCLVFSSKNLMKNIIGQSSNCPIKYACMDGTYKLTILGYPLLVVGTQDIDHKFRPIALALSKHEREEDYCFVLRSIKYSMKEYFNYEYTIDLVMADASVPIYKAARSVFGEQYVHAMCSVHFWRNVQKKVATLVTKDDRKEVRKDLGFWQNIHEPNLFETAATLFEKKWENKISDFLNYFFENWIYSEFKNWYLGSIPAGFSATNNGLEGFNNGIKAKYTEWDRLTLGDFIKVIKEIVTDYSTENSISPFPISFTFGKDIWTKVQIMKDHPYLQKNSSTFFWTHADEKGNHQKVNTQMVTKYSNIKRAKSFESFIESYCLWKVNLNENVYSSTCTCPNFRLRHYCKHLLLALLKLEKIEIPDEYSQKKIVEGNKKRGKSKKAGSALD